MLHWLCVRLLADWADHQSATPHVHVCASQAPRTSKHTGLSGAPRRGEYPLRHHFDGFVRLLARLGARLKVWLADQAQAHVGQF